MSDQRDAFAQATLLLDAFIAHHHAAAIPSMIAACVGWAVEHGAGDLVRSTLTNAVAVSHEAEKKWKEMQS